VPYVRCGTYILLYAALIAPLITAGLRRACEKARLHPPPHDRWRSFAIFLSSPALGCLFWYTFPSAAHFATGAALGAMVSLCATFVLYRLRGSEAATVLGAAALWLAISFAVAIGVFLAVNYVVLTGMREAHHAHEFKTSPLGRRSSGTTPKPGPVARAREARSEARRTGRRRAGGPGLPPRACRALATPASRARDRPGAFDGPERPHLHNIFTG